MQSISAPMNRLLEDGAWFARAHELRLWLVRCDDNLRGPALKAVPKLEFHADNRSPWSVLLDAFTVKDDGWRLRADRLVGEWGERVAAFAREGVEQGAVPPAQDGGLQAFTRAAQAVVAAERAPLAGLVVVLAPGVVERPEALFSALTAMILDRGLAAVRWVVVLDVDVPRPDALLERLGPAHAQVSECVVDEELQRRDFAAMLSPRAPQFGAAGPLGVTPPRRVDAPPPLPASQRDAALRAAGVDPALVHAGPELRAAALGAALALAEGRGAEALAHQRRACELCVRLGLTELHVICRVTLASYLSGLDRREEAKREAVAAIAEARKSALHRVESQALLALGLLHNLDREPAPAIEAYEGAGRAAELGDEPVLAIEGWRMAGTLAAQTRQEPQAEAAFREALRIAAAADPKVARGSSAAEAARQLAAVYTERSMTAQARSLHALADMLEQEGADDARE